MPVILYALVDQRPGSATFGLPFYVGIGTMNRPHQHLRMARRGQCRNRLLGVVLSEHVAFDVEPAIEILSAFDTRPEADAAERAAIARLGRIGRDDGGILCNVARGADGPDSTLMSDPEVLARMAEASRRYWADPEARAAQAARSRASHARPEIREKIAATTKMALNSGEARAKHLAALRRINAALTTEQRIAAEAKRAPESKARSIAALIASFNDPDIQARRRENSREPQRISWLDEEIRRHRINAMTGVPKTMTEAAIAARITNLEATKTPKAREARTQAALALWQNPEHRAKQSAARTAAWADPEKRANMLEGRGEGIAQSWVDTEVREKRTAGVRQAITDKWRDDPDYAERARAGLRAAWQDPAKREARIAKMLATRAARGATPVGADETERRSNAMRSLNATKPTETRSAEQAASWTNPETRAARLEGIRKAAQDPALKAARVAAMLAGKQRKARERAAAASEGQTVEPDQH